MSYTAEISRANPACIIFLVDQSKSMQDRIGGEHATGSKADVVADALNRLLADLCIKCAKEEGVRDYFHVGVVGYGTSVKPALSGVLSGRYLVPLSEIALGPARVEERKKKVPDGAGGLVEQTVRFPIWIDPIANGGTPMSGAIAQAEQLLSQWVASHPSSFPPVVLNLTDGESTDGDPAQPAGRLRALSSTDGAVLLFNLHVSSSNASPIIFPDNDIALPDAYAKNLYSISSNLPLHMSRYATQQLGVATSDGTRGFVFNADVASIVQFLDIGTRASDLR